MKNYGGLSMKQKAVYLLIITIVLVFFPAQVLANEKQSDICVYPILPGSQEWDELGTVENKKASCKIPEEKLRIMTDSELINAVVDYPFLADIFACDDYLIPVKELMVECDALRELSKRQGAVCFIMDFIKSNYTDDNRIITDIEEYKLEALMIILSYNESFSSKLEDSDIDFINYQSHMVRIKYSGEGLRIAYVYTPNGTPIICDTRDCSHANPDYHSDLDDAFVSAYGVYLISEGSCRYNCHSYAWYNPSIYNSLWMYNPSAYMSDGSYYSVLDDMSSSSTYVNSGDRICYGSTSGPAHSAIVYSYSSSSPLSSRYVKSKWGNAGVFGHTLTNVPSEYWYSGYYASAWRIA